MNDSNEINDADYPLGRGLPQHPAKIRLQNAVSALAADYEEADLMFERDLPGHNTTGWATDADDVGDLPFEMCQTINGSWGFDLQDRKHKSSKELIQLLVKAAGYNSNLLLNVGPMPNGEIQPEHVKSLSEVGEWLKVHGETIYGTTNGPIDPQDWGVSTQKGKGVYLHILDFVFELWNIPQFLYPSIEH